MSISSGVVFMEYQTLYEGELDIQAIGNQLNSSGIEYKFYTQNQINNNYTYKIIEFNFGTNFNNSQLNDTRCIIYQTPPDGKYHVNIRMYGADCSNMNELEQYKPAIEDSMDFIVDIIFNVTGKSPIRTEYVYEDGGSLEYP